MLLGPIPSGKGFKKKAKKAARSAKRKAIDLIEDIGEDPRPKHGSRVRKAIDIVEGMRGGSICGGGTSCGCGAPQPPSRLPSGNLAAAGKSSREMSGSGLKGMHGHARFARALYDRDGGFHGGKLKLGHTIKKGWEHTTHGVATAAKAIAKHAKPGSTIGSMISEGLDVATPAALTAVGSAFGSPELGAAAPIARAGVKKLTGYGGKGSGRFAKGSDEAKEWAKKMREARMGKKASPKKTKPVLSEKTDKEIDDLFDSPITSSERKGGRKQPKHTLASLKKMAKEAKIKGFSKMKKQELLDALNL